MRLLLVAVAGAAGAACRYGVGVLVGPHAFPWSTLGINTAGSFLLGVVLVAGPARMSGDAVVAVAAGFLGAFTTFSTFSFEVQALLRDGRAVEAATYVGASLLVGVAAAALGATVGQALTA